MSKDAESSKTIRLWFKKPSYDRIVHSHTEVVARNMGFGEEQVFEVSLAVEEAYTNAIEHGGQNGVDFEIEITYLLFKDRLEILIQDSGVGFQHNGFLGLPPADCLQSIRGRGLNLIYKLSDRVEIFSKLGIGTLIRITKLLPSSPKVISEKKGIISIIRGK